MKVKTLIKYLEKYQEADIFFGNDEKGSIFFNNCDIETDNKKVLIYPFGKEMIYEKIKLDQVIEIK
jgi:hypothetical protein